jgi:hypothetical protein
MVLLRHHPNCLLCLNHHLLVEAMYFRLSHSIIITIIFLSILKLQKHLVHPNLSLNFILWHVEALLHIIHLKAEEYPRFIILYRPMMSEIIIMLLCTRISCILLKKSRRRRRVLQPMVLLVLAQKNWNPLNRPRIWSILSMKIAKWWVEVGVVQLGWLVQEHNKHYLQELILWRAMVVSHNLRRDVSNHHGNLRSKG